MPGMSIVVPHALTQNEALTRIKDLLATVKTDYGDKVTDLTESWSGNRADFAFKAMGMGVSGNLVVTSSQIELKGNLPFAALPFKGRIEETIRSRATQLLAP